MPHNSLNLCFFWHMHQPDYRGSDGIMSMPWVFLHAIKDYYEMPWLLSQHKGIKATFNITAPLIEQLYLYENPLQYDYFLSLWMEHPSKLSDDAKEFLIKTCKSTQYETMVKPIENFRVLYEKEIFNDAELIDFELLFMLAWCGNYLRQNNKVVRELFTKEKHFTQEDKKNLLDTLTDFIQTILPFYAKLQKEGVISLATTPYNHPILPLLLDMENAKRANKHTTIVKNPLSLKEDAIEQVARSIALYEATFGVKPKGFWPAEGAVDEESIAIYKAQGISWIATDEAILFQSLQDKKRSNLYKPYDFNGVSIGFRDHKLSDLIGFNYRFQKGNDASENFMQMIEPIAINEHDATLFIILDGENAWEFFEKNGYDFFTSFYNRLSNTPWCNTVTMDGVTQLKKRGTLESIAPGSWINGNFDTWSGDAEKNRAWELLYQTKRDYQNHTDFIHEERQKEIQSHFLASECSDWFWWYGNDHTTEFSLEFDKLFREHLMRIYTLLHRNPPANLFLPIAAHKESSSFLLQPQSTISPSIDGKNSSFFKWLGSGSIDERKLYSTMERVHGPIEMIYYGQDNKNIYLAFDGQMHRLRKLQLQVIIEETSEILTFDIEKNYDANGTQFVADERIEVAVAKWHFKDYTIIHLRFDLLQGREIIQTMPGYGALALNLEESYSANWFI